MQDNVMQLQGQPFIKLVQANMDLLTRFTTSPEVAAQAAEGASQMLQQASESAMKLMNSGAYAQLLQGMLKNYTDFLTEVSQSSMTMVSQGQASFMRQAQDATREAIDAADGRARRVRQPA